MNILILTVRRSTLESDVYRRQILTTKVDPRAVRVKIGHRIRESTKREYSSFEFAMFTFLYRVLTDFTDSVY